MGILQTVEDVTVGQNPLAAAAVSVVSNIIQRVWPDPAEQQKAQQALLEMQQNGELEHLHAATQLALAQADVSKTEASNPSVFVAGGRPAIIWTCAITLFCYYVPYAIAATVLWVIQCVSTKTLAPHPDIGISDMIGLVVSTLGLSGIRSFDKVKGVDTKQIGS